MYEVRSAVTNSKKDKIANVIVVILFVLIASLEAIFLSTVLNGKLEEAVSVISPVEIGVEPISASTILKLQEFKIFKIPKADLKEIEENEEPNIPDNRPRVALTFDDGPHPQNTLKILDILNRYNAKATFFMLGQNVERSNGIPKKVIEQGSEIGTHTWDHKNLNKLSKEEVQNEINSSCDKIKEFSGTEVKYFRPPYGNANTQVGDIAKMNNKYIILWNIDTEDWKSKNAEMVANHVLDNVKDGDIVLMHDIYLTTVEACEKIVEELTNRGYRLVTISELFEGRENMEYGKKYYYSR